MDWDKPPTLQEFKKTLDAYVDDTMNINDPDGFIYSHKIKGEVDVYLDDEDDDIAYEIVGLDLDQLGGCGCPVRIVIRIRRCKDD